MAVIAYDIDGALTEQGCRDDLLDKADGESNVIGVLTARTDGGVHDFMVSHPRIAEAVDFVTNQRPKALAMMDIEEKYDEDLLIYKGSWYLDKVNALVAGWEYTECNE